MRHFSVPSVRAQEIIEKLRQMGWISNDHRIHPSEDGKILIPLHLDAPNTFPNNFIGDIISIEPIIKHRTRSWKEIFEEEVGGLGLFELDERWAKGHEIVGDIMIQPAQRFPDEIPPNVDALIRAKMEAHPRIRMIVFDYGVRGEYRVRDLEIAAVRTDKIIQGDELDSLPLDLLDTRTTIKESGLNINIDPSKVYYSAKLETERLETTRILLDFKQELNRPLSICDPYCGVGPNLAHILAYDGLSSSILANDLNPDCIPFLFENLLPLRSHPIPEKIDGLIQITPDLLIGNLDALSIPLDKSQQGRWDVLLVNLPHDSLDHLPSLIPLLRTNSPSLIRGWSIIPQEEVTNLSQKLTLISKGRSSIDDIEIKVRKQYGPSHDMVGYWMRLSGAPTGI
jgi:tRNA G37 N-methylase Trm5